MLANEWDGQLGIADPDMADYMAQQAEEDRLRQDLLGNPDVQKDFLAEREVKAPDLTDWDYSQEPFAETAEFYDSMEEGYTEWLKSINATSTELNTVEKYYSAKYNNTPEYQLLIGYSNAIEREHISTLTGFDFYMQTSDEIQATLVGQKAANGIEIESYATHFVDRIIGHPFTQSEGKREGVSIADALDALLNPEELGPVRYMDDGDVRQTLYGKNAVVTISIRDGRLIQTNPS